MKQIKIRIHTDGKIEAETLGIKGKGCLGYISVLQKLTDAAVVDSAFTAEYRQRDNLLVSTEEIEVKA